MIGEEEIYRAARDVTVAGLGGSTLDDSMRMLGVDPDDAAKTIGTYGRGYLDQHELTTGSHISPELLVVVLKLALATFIVGVMCGREEASR